MFTFGHPSISILISGLFIHFWGLYCSFIVVNYRKLVIIPLSKNVDMSPDSGQGYEAEGKCGVKSVKSTKKVCIDYPNLTNLT